MFTDENLRKYTNYITTINIKPKSILRVSEKETDIVKPLYEKSEKIQNNNIEKNETNIIKYEANKKKKETIYKPKQKDSLFWCFYILKHGYSNYEMEINNQYFVVEKTEKFKYIDMFRKNKDLLRLHKIKPFTELEDDLANQHRISIKTFFALCILENINVLLVDNRKIYELTCVDIDDMNPVHVVSRNNKTFEHHIELDVTNEIVQNYRDTYYKMNGFDSTLKAIGSYKLDELVELCLRLNINLDTIDKKKKTKKDIYELLVLNY
jgi:hypothetical protein